ncbi:inorganic phosphate transporter [Thiocapsa imhoffii]|uniref:Phosphate transporter n=1 Tax=Thiocapsa imhoffii TaxID=382777 RepID=A0A9X1B8E7_9GAMM|nr:inorganic phosphate transporter [Thiocapsa imhoffii]MBK1644824.1 inorganic phosphate transporter [Thiocapsa imhoffii]
MELSHLNELEKATKKGRLELFRLGIGLLFIIGVMFYAIVRAEADGSLFVVIAAMIGGYMAMNIGANDVANNVGPAVGSKALTLGGALVIAAIFEAAGAIIAGGEVVGTIRSGIIDPNLIADADTFVWVMMAALLAAAIWLNIATILGAPVSTTHSIVGAVLGAGIASSGLQIANWGTVGTIAMSWVISPLMGGVIAAAFLYLIKRTITYQVDLLTASRRTVPYLIAAMAFAFVSYLMLKAFDRLWSVAAWQALTVGAVSAVAVWFMVKPVINRKAVRIANTKAGVNQLFTVPLIFAAALLSFAHGSNDVANAVGPLAAIVDVMNSGTDEIVRAAPVPFWVMVVGAIGIAIGLGLFGPKVIRTVGSEITELDKMRAYCIAMAATITVIIASQLGIPVSTTHVAVGAVFGVGFLREYLKSQYDRMLDDIKSHHPEGDQAAIRIFIARFAAASIDEKGSMLRELKRRSKLRTDPANFSKRERRGLRKVYRRELVKRSQVLKIVAAWVITVPASAVLSAILFFTIRGMLLP